MEEQIESEVKYAIGPGTQRERNERTGHMQHVGLDIFEITGQVVIHDVVYLTLKRSRWVRSKEVLERNG